MLVLKCKIVGLSSKTHLFRESVGVCVVCVCERERKRERETDVQLNFVSSSRGEKVSNLILKLHNRFTGIGTQTTTIDNLLLKFSYVVQDFVVLVLLGGESGHFGTARDIPVFEREKREFSIDIRVYIRAWIFE